METETQVGRGRAGNRGKLIGQARAAAIEPSEEGNYDMPETGQPAKKTRKVKPASERTHFSFIIELPMSVIGPLKYASIKAQRRGDFQAGMRENDAQALLRHKLREFVQEVMDEAEADE